MLISQKCQYALRAIFELAKREGEGPVKIAEIAKSQVIPHRFLEVILGQMKQAGFVRSQRGMGGGYTIARPPKEITVGQVICFIQGPVEAVDCVANNSRCPLYGDCVFFPMWKKVGKVISDAYDGTTIQDLLDEERKKTEKYAPCYSI